MHFHNRKWNALLGNMLALFVLDFLDEALREVSTLVDANMNVVALLQRFEADNRSRYQTFRQANFDDSLKAIVPDESQHDSIDWNLLVKGSSYCHLAVLPSETRRKGIISNDTSRVLDLFSPFDSHAISRTVADAATVGVTSAGVDNASSTTSDTMRLVYETDDKTPDRFPCNETLYIDFREYFYVSEPEGWRHVIVPNEAELNEYGTSINGVNQAIQSSAAVAFCLKFCNHFVCPTEDLNIAAILSGNATMEINGRPVTQLTQFINTGHECVLTGHDEGRDWIPNAEGRFVIRARALWPKSFLRFTSFVVWYTNGDSDSGSLTEKNK